MNRSESVQTIAPAFLKAQAKMRAAPKDADNPHFRSKYSDFASVVEAVKSPLNENGIAFLQPVRLTAEGVEVETVLLHTSGEFFSDTLTIPLGKRDAQSVGSAISYGKRYGLQSLCGLPSDDDDGHAATEAAPAKQQRKPDQPKANGTPAKNGAPAKTPDAAEVQEWSEWLGTDPTLEELNHCVPAMAKLDAETKAAVWPLVKAHGERAGLKFDRESKMFMQPAGGAA